MTLRISGNYDFSWPFVQAAEDNPPADPDFAAVTDLYDDLGTAAAVGHLAARLNFPAGGELVQLVSDFVREAPSLAETGSILGAVASGAGKAGAAVEARAGKVWAAMAKNPGLVTKLGVLGVGAGLGATWLGGEERVKAAAIGRHYDLLADQLAGVDPKEAARILANAGPLGSGSGGLSLWTVAGLGVVGLGLVWAWRRFA